MNSALNSLPIYFASLRLEPFIILNGEARYAMWYYLYIIFQMRKKIVEISFKKN